MIRKPLTRDEEKLKKNYQARIQQQMRRYFAPASIVPPPNAIPSLTGGRNTVLTAQNSANSTPTDSATIQLTNGMLTWYFKTKFKNPPNVTATAVTSTAGGPEELYLQGQGSNVAVIVLSTDKNDSRLVNLHAVGAPS